MKDYRIEVSKHPSPYSADQADGSCRIMKWIASVRVNNVDGTYLQTEHFAVKRIALDWAREVVQWAREESRPLSSCHCGENYDPATDDAGMPCCGQCDGRAALLAPEAEALVDVDGNQVTACPICGSYEECYAH